MARIEAKRKEKLSSVIWTWVVVGVLGAVVITGLVLGIIYLVDVLDKEEEVTYAEQYPNAKLISYADLDKILSGEQSELHVAGTTYVLVYSPNYEAHPNGESISTYVNDAVKACDEDGVNGHDAFYVVNVLSEDNKDSSITDYTNLSSLSTSKYPYLLVISPENGEYEIVEDGIITNVREINDYLINFAGTEVTE
jgi:hypothetical protein